MMKVVSISDVHIKKQDDENAKLFLAFLDSRSVKESDHIVLLGDIFDLLVGNKIAYLSKMEKIFCAIEQASKNKKLIYISGNHDFSIKKILEKRFKNLNFQYSESPITLNDKGSTIYLSHGDEIDYTDLAYKRWKRVYSNKTFQFLINSFLPYSLIDWLGSRASKSSRRRGSKSFNYEKASKKYISLTEEFVKKGRADFYILGHTHIKYENRKFVNNGFFPMHKSFAVYEANSLKLVEL